MPPKLSTGKLLSSIKASGYRNNKEPIYNNVQTAKLERSVPPKEPEITQGRGRGGGGGAMYKTFRNHQSDPLKTGNRFSCANKNHRVIK